MRYDGRWAASDTQTHITVTAATGLALLVTQNAQVAWFSLGALTSTLVGERNTWESKV